MKCLIILSIAIALADSYENSLTRIWKSVDPSRTVLDVKSDVPEGRGFKQELLYPGRYFEIENSTFDPLVKAEFKPKIIPLVRDEVQGRAMEDQPTAMRRSYYYFGDDDSEENEQLRDDDEDDEEDEEGEEKKNKRRRGPKIKRKYMKYMLPLLLAYKLKFFTLIPLLMGGLVLLTGATGMAGFFFALFAAVMGLSKTGTNY